MSVLPKELLLFTQLFGALPLRYSKQRPGLGVSNVLYMKNLVVILLLTILSNISLWVDYDAYLSGKPIRMVHSTNVVAVFLDVTFLNLMSLAVFVSSLRKSDRFVNLVEILEKIDRYLRFPLNNRLWTYKVWLMSLYITALIINTETRLMYSVGEKGVWHLFDLLHYYVQGALFLQFTFVVHSFTERFRLINKMIEREVIRRTHLVKTVSDPGTFTIGRGGYLLDNRLKRLIDSYSRLCEAVQQANHFYSSQLFGAVSSSFIHNIITLYFFIQQIRPAGVEEGTSMFNEMIWVFTHILHLVLLVWPCTQLIDTVSETAPMICHLLSREVNVHNTEVRRQLETFLLELLHYHVGFSALGFFEIHNHILTSIASSVATYLVIMIQFRSGDG